MLSYVEVVFDLHLWAFGKGHVVESLVERVGCRVFYSLEGIRIVFNVMIALYLFFILATIRLILYGYLFITLHFKLYLKICFISVVYEDLFNRTVFETLKQLHSINRINQH